jgi:tetratricopeptide (TPR) repeat protein
MGGWAALAIVLTIASCSTAGWHTPALGASNSSSSVAVERLAPGAVEARRQALLRQMIARPNDLDLAYQYAQLSSQVGDYESAISTLERILIYAPNTPRLELELGILYYRIGSYEIARSYFATVLASPNVPPSVAAQVTVYMQALAAQAAPAPFSATLYTALRWESNANSALATQSVTLNGINFTLNQNALAAPDWSSVSVGTLHYSYDLRNQGDRIEFDVIAYNASYFKLTDINLDFVEATLGPSFNLRRWNMDKSRLFVYAIGDETLLGNDQYFAGGGAGVRILSYAIDRSVLDVRFETRDLDYSNTTLATTSSLYTGLQTRFGGSYSYFLAPGLILTAESYGQRVNAETGFYSDWEFGASAGFGWTFGQPFAWRWPWTLQVGAGGLNRNYDDPDPMINMNKAEVDRQFWGRAAVIVPVAETWAMIPQVEIRDQQSNYPTSNFDDFSALVGLQKRFF